MLSLEELKKFWEENGYIHLKNFFSSMYIDQINQLIEDIWSGKKILDGSYTIDTFIGTEKEKRVYFRDVQMDARRHPYKINDLFLSSKLVRDMVAGEELAPILQILLGGFPMVCNSLNLEYGSQQDYHFDTFYMPSPSPNKMVASWIALEDTTEQSGPLTYYPGSHKIPPFLFSNNKTVIIDNELPAFNDYILKQIAEHGLQEQTLLAEKGDVLIWHSQLFHGGKPILDKKKTRKSMVTHYFTKEDFPDIQTPQISEQSCYMKRPYHPIFEQETDLSDITESDKEHTVTSFLRKLFGYFSKKQTK